MRALIGIGVLGACLCLACEQPKAPAPAGQAPAATPAAAAPKPASVPPLDPRNIVSIATASPDHTTLVAALKAADYVTSVANPGPLTVFAPTNAAFESLPPGTVENLLKPENVDQLRNVLKYHVTTSSLAASSFKDGQSLGMANGDHATLKVEGDEVSIDGAHIVASIPASNGMVHVIDAVLLPPAKP
jgi:uncharacterized surface protein with fasciclin (FAS1) repeats